MLTSYFSVTTLNKEVYQQFSYYSVMPIRKHCWPRRTGGGRSSAHQARPKMLHMTGQKSEAPPSLATSLAPISDDDGAGHSHRHRHGHSSLSLCYNPEGNLFT